MTNDFLIISSEILFFCSIISITLVFINPLFILVYPFFRKVETLQSADIKPFLSLLIIARNGEEAIEKKIKNSIALNYPSDRIEIIVFSDGSTDKTEPIANTFADQNVSVYSSEAHEGKNNAINEAVKKSKGEILVFSDVDVKVEADALGKIIRHFADARVGGVCGNKVILEKKQKMDKAQFYYTKLANWIKELERKTGSVSTNDGTLYAVRGELFRPMPPGVTDDLFACLSIILQGYLFLFEKEAKALITAPSKGTTHEISRRRRIVSGSLKNFRLAPQVLNPFKYEIIAVSLFCNKVLRRIMPLALFVLLISSFILSFNSFFILLFFIAQVLFYGLGALHGVILQHSQKFPLFRKGTAVIYYFLVGNWGTLLGVIDFLRHQEAVKWEPE